MPAHSEIASIVEKEHTGRAIVPGRLAQKCPNQRIGSPRLEDYHPADVIELIGESGDALLHGAAAKIRPALDNDARWLALGVGVDYSHVIDLSVRGARPAIPPLPELAPLLFEERFLRTR